MSRRERSMLMKRNILRFNEDYDGGKHPQYLLKRQSVADWNDHDKGVKGSWSFVNYVQSVGKHELLYFFRVFDLRQRFSFSPHFFFRVSIINFYFFQSALLCSGDEKLEVTVHGKSCAITLDSQRHHIFSDPSWFADLMAK